MKLNLNKTKTAEDLASTLSENIIIPIVKRSKVTLLALKENNKDEKVKTQGKGYVDPHPEGADRGFVPFWEINGIKAYFNGEEWLEG